MKRILQLTLVGLTSAVISTRAQPYDLNWSDIDSGGGPVAGGSFSLNGTVGQPDAGPSLSGGGFNITSGFWASVAEAAPRISIRLTVANTVILSWPNPSTGFVLQETSNLSAPGGGWTDVAQPPVVVGPNSEVALPITGIGRWFRLLRP